MESWKVGYGARAAWVVLPAILAFQAACGSTPIRNKAGLDNVLNRAEFDLSCPRNVLQLTPLQHDGRLVTSYGVAGCGRRAVYVRGPRNTFVADPTSPPPEIRAPISYGQQVGYSPSPSPGNSEPTNAADQAPGTEPPEQPE